MPLLRPCLAALLLLALSAPALAQRPPNVVVLLTDDQGTLDAGIYGSDDLHTPHIDALARRGVRFTQFYAAAPVCSPSRAALMTGRYPPRAGVPGNVSSARGNPGMPADEVTIAEMLKDHGYATAHIGKWHLGYTPETMPNAQGFDYSYGHMGGVIDNYSHFFYWNGPNRHDLWRNGEEIFEDGSYFPDRVADETIAFMEAHRDTAFFVYVALNTPHYPYQGDAEWLRYYEALVPYPRNLYAAFLTSQDARIGRIMRALDELGLREETLVIFQSDHGHSTEERAHFGGGNAGPYRGAKFSLFEGGIRVPAIVSMPGTLPEGEVRTQAGHGTDWLPTIAALTGAPLPQRRIDGKNVLPILLDAGAPPAHEVLFWDLGAGDNRRWAVRQGDWKLLGNPIDTSQMAPLTDADSLFLVDLSQDIGERQNRARDYPERVRTLQAIYREIAGSYR